HLREEVVLDMQEHVIGEGIPQPAALRAGRIGNFVCVVMRGPDREERGQALADPHGDDVVAQRVTCSHRNTAAIQTTLAPSSPHTHRRTVRLPLASAVRWSSSGNSGPKAIACQPDMRALAASMSPSLMQSL